MKNYFLPFLITIFFHTSFGCTHPQLPEQIKVILINGTKPANTQNIELNNERNQLVFRFEGELGHSFDDKEESLLRYFRCTFLSGKGKRLS